MTDEITWADYYDENEDREPRELLLEALSRFGLGSHEAVDLGCGSGIDTLGILERGWRVFATDAEAEGIRRLRSRVRAGLTPALRTTVARMEEVELPQADLIWAGFSLFFCPPRRWSEVWPKVRDAVRPGGRFGGQILGERDTWAPDREISSFSRERPEPCSTASRSNASRRRRRTARRARVRSTGTSSTCLPAGRRDGFGRRGVTPRPPTAS
jgi:tellurite methyltransferase